MVFYSFSNCPNIFFTSRHFFTVPDRLSPTSSNPYSFFPHLSTHPCYNSVFTMSLAELAESIVHNCTIFLCFLDDGGNIDDQCRGPIIMEKDHLAGLLATESTNLAMPGSGSSTHLLFEASESRNPTISP